MEHHCTTRSAMNSIPFPYHIEREPIASEFYKHPYGGIARDIFVSREGFMRFFELEDEGILIAEAWAGQGKIYNDIGDSHETMGYINLFPGGRMTYMITIIDRQNEASEKYLAEVMEGLSWN